MTSEHSSPYNTRSKLSSFKLDKEYLPYPAFRRDKLLARSHQREAALSKWTVFTAVFLFSLCFHFNPTWIQSDTVYHPSLRSPFSMHKEFIVGRPKSMKKAWWDICRMKHACVYNPVAKFRKTITKTSINRLSNDYAIQNVRDYTVPIAIALSALFIYCDEYVVKIVSCAIAFIYCLCSCIWLQSFYLPIDY